MSDDGGAAGRRTRLKIRPYRGAAAGMKAITTVARQAMAQTGALRGFELLRQVNQEGGFDCPGCAWPDPAHRTVAEFCENGAKAVLDEGGRARCDPAFFALNSISELRGWSDRRLNDAGRLTHPMVRERGADRYVPIAWEEALSRIGARLAALPSPHQAAFYTSGRASNEAAFLYQLFVRRFGTNNLPDCSNMCHESSGVGLTEVIGVGKGTVTLDDFAVCDCILIIGQNPGTNHPRMLSTLQAAARRGAEIIVINPLREPGLLRFKHPQEVVRMMGGGTPIATQYLQVRINGDVALLKALQKAVLELEAAAVGTVVDHAFIQEHTTGFNGLREALDALDWDTLVEDCGVPRELIERAAKSYATADASIACWAMGLTQHENGVANIQEVTNLLLLRGNIGRPGAGACPVRGHSNVQGDRTMGIWDRPPEDFLARLDAVFGFSSPRAHGTNTIEAIEAMRDGRLSAFVALGGNFVAAAPDTQVTIDALHQCDLTVQISTKLNRSHVECGAEAFILPCLGRTERDELASGEQFVTVENSMGVVHMSRGSQPPASEHLLSEPTIVCRLAQATLGTDPHVDWAHLQGDLDRVRDLIAQVIEGFEDLNTRVREPGGFLLDNPARERIWMTPDKKARFAFHPLPRNALEPGQLLMMTIRSHDQFNTTVYSDNDRYRGISGERRVVFMNADDMASLGLAPKQRVDLLSHWKGEERTAPGFYVVPFDLPPGCCATYFPEANPLVPLGHHAAGSFTPASKSVVVSVRPAA